MSQPDLAFDIYRHQGSIWPHGRPGSYSEIEHRPQEAANCRICPPSTSEYWRNWLAENPGKPSSSPGKLE
jgi:hypothetical protein